MQGGELEWLRYERVQDGELRLELLRVADHSVHRVPACFFAMRVYRSDQIGVAEVAGAINLRVSGLPHIELYAGHVGYEVKPAHRGRRYASRALRLIVPVAARLGINTLWITCDPENVASRRTLELAGAELVEIVDVAKESVIHQAGHPRKCRYRLATR